MAETPIHFIYFLSFGPKLLRKSHIDPVIMSGCKLCPQVDPNRQFSFNTEVINITQPLTGNSNKDRNDIIYYDVIIIVVVTIIIVVIEYFIVFVMIILCGNGGCGCPGWMRLTEPLQPGWRDAADRGTVGASPPFNMERFSRNSFAAA